VIKEIFRTVRAALVTWHHTLRMCVMCAVLAGLVVVVLDHV